LATARFLVRQPVRAGNVRLLAKALWSKPEAALSRCSGRAAASAHLAASAAPIHAMTTAQERPLL